MIYCICFKPMYNDLYRWRKWFCMYVWLARSKNSKSVSTCTISYSDLPWHAEVTGTVNEEALCWAWYSRLFAWLYIKFFYESFKIAFLWNITRIFICMAFALIFTGCEAFLGGKCKVERYWALLIIISMFSMWSSVFFCKRKLLNHL